MARVALALLLLLFLPSSGLAAGRVALVIGNGAYAQVGKLPNPASDAKAIEAMLKAAGFDNVLVKQDLGVAAMRRALRDFSDQVRDADIAVVFYAGHGIEVNGANYLIPVDAVLERDVDVEDEAVPLDRVTQILEQAKRLRLVILDACRDNPFVRSMRRTMSSRSIGRGLAKVEVLTSDTLIAFAAKAGSTAEDGQGSNSPYTTALIKHLTTPGLDLRLALGRVRDDVLKSTANRQEPFLYGSLGGTEISLVPAAGAQPRPPVIPDPVQTSEAERAWAQIKDTTSVALLEAFVARYRDSFYADVARTRIAELKRQAAVDPIVATPPTPPKKAEGPKSLQAAPFDVATPLTIRLQDSFPTADASTRDPLNDVVQALTTLSGGKLNVDLLAAGSVAPAFKLLDTVQSGQLDAAWTVPAYWYGRTRAFGIISGAGPMGLEPAAFVRWLEADGEAQANRLMSEKATKKVRSLACGLMGPGGEWFKKPIRQVDDFRGLKFRTVGFPIEVGKELGFAVNVLPGGEIVSALDRGILDGSDWSSPGSGISLGLPDVTKYLHYPGWARPVHLLELIVGEQAWSKLGPGGQAGVEAVCRRNVHKGLARIPELERQALDELKRRGVTVQPYPPAVLNSSKQAARRALDNAAKQDPDFARVLASYDRFR